MNRLYTYLLLLYGAIATHPLSAQPISCDDIINTGVNHSILLINLNPTLNGSPLPPGSYIIALYDDNGTLRCAGYAQWIGVNTAIAAFGDDSTTPEKDGYSVGDVFIFRVELPDGTLYDDKCITVQYASGSIFSNSNTFAANGISGLSAFDIDDVNCFDCPVLGLNIGDFCDDGDDATVNDAVTAACTCAGEPSEYRIIPYIVANAGDWQTVNNYSLTWTLGQIAGETLYANGDEADCYWLRQGFQQPFEWPPPEMPLDCIILAVDIPTESMTVQVFPNPSSGTVTVGFETAFLHVLTLSLMDGRVLYSQESADVQHQIALNKVPAGTYLLTVSDATSRTKRFFKLIKY